MTTLGGQSLLRHIEHGDLGAVRTLLANRTINLDERDDNGETFLMVASRCGETEIVRELLKQSGIDVNAVDNDNWTALLNAAKEGHHEITELLISRRALVEHKDMGGWTALMWACYKGRLKTCQMLLDNGANPNIKGEHHMSCVTWAAGRGYTEIVNLLLARGAQVNTSDKYGTSPLIWAARKGHIEIVNAVLAAGANVDVAGMYSWTALIVAARAGCVAVVDSLLEHSPNVNAGDKDGYTALTWAAKDGHTEIVNKLLQAGAYVNPPDRFGDTILIHAVKGGHLDVVKALLKKCADVDVEGVDNKTALYWSADKGHCGVTRALLEYNPNMEIYNKDCDTALLRAVRNRNYDLAKLLMDKGAKVSSQDKKGDTALHVSVRARSKRITELLLRNPKEGRLLYLPNKAGETPYQLDSQHERRLLTQVYGAQNLNADDNIQGYDLYSNTIADVLSEPSLHTPINVGLYAKWGSGKSFLISRLIRDMQDFTEHSTDPVFEFSWIQFLITFSISAIIGVILGFTVRWEVGVGVGGGLFLLQYMFLGIMYMGLTRQDWIWAEHTGDYLARKLQYLSLLLKIIFCNEPPGPSRETAAVKFLFTDNARLASVVGDKFITAMIGTLCESLEKEYGTLVTRLYKVMQPKPASLHGRFKSMCCIPYFLIVLFIILLLVAIAILLAIYGVTDLPRTVSSVLIGLGVTVGVALIINALTCGRMLLSVGVPAKRRVQKIGQSMDASKIESFMQKLKREVELLGSMTRCMDACRNTHTRLVVIVDGLDSCEQEKLVQVLDTVHMLFSDSGSPFITILAVDPHVIIKGIEQNLHGLFRDSSINGHDYLRNIVQLPFFLQTQAMPRPRNFNREESSTANLGDRKFTQYRKQSRDRDDTMSPRPRAESQMSSSILSLEELKRRPSRRSKQTRGASQVDGVPGSNLLRQPSHLDLTKSLNKNTYFSDVNPRNMKRLMNIIAVTGRLLRANNLELNWYKLAAWVNITEQWPYRLSWIILEVEDNDSIEDSITLKTIYGIVQQKLPNHRDVDPLLEIDRNERKLDFFLTNHMPILTAGDLRRFLPCTINVDPYHRKLIREFQQHTDSCLINDNGMKMLGQTASVDTHWPYRRPTSRMDYPSRDSPRQVNNTRPGSALRGGPMSPFTGSTASMHPSMMYTPGGHGGYYVSPNYMQTQSLQQQYNPTMPTVQQSGLSLSSTGSRNRHVKMRDGQPMGRLSKMSVEEVANLVERIDGLNQANIPRYVEQLKSNNIQGSVLLTCELMELKPVLEMSFGDWELFRTVVLLLRDQEPGGSEEELFDNSTNNSMTDPHQKFTKPVPPFNVDHKLYMPQAGYSKESRDDPRRKRHSSGGRVPQQSTARGSSQEAVGRDQWDGGQQQATTSRQRMESIEEPMGSYTSDIPHNNTQNFKPMSRKDSFFGEAMLESELIREVVEASGVCTSGSDSDSETPEDNEDSVRVSADLDFGSPRPPSNVKATYQSLKSEEEPSKFVVGSVGAYQSSEEGESDELEEMTTVKSRSHRKSSFKGARTPTKAELTVANLNGAVAGGGAPDELFAKSPRKEEGSSRMHRMFTRNKDRDKTGEDSQRTSIGSSVLSNTDLADLSELANFQPIISPSTSTEHLALRKISQKEDSAAPSAFKSITPASSRASSRASSYNPYLNTAGREEILMEPMGGRAAEKPSGRTSDEPSTSLSGRRLLSQLPAMSTVDDAEAKQSTQGTLRANTSAEEVRITMPRQRGETTKGENLSPPDTEV